ncbi:hypothetical protein [Glycomyces sp. NRRL B-16210]|uniref:hypothetical protein n=1 Tax=Glycomyces sp. NRRL B-16210 TaxID=1463821 RepID=UPI000ABD33CD|nr:hypothetical protein [Glycomyces sp. NRRL B-16210]
MTPRERCGGRDEALACGDGLVIAPTGSGKTLSALDGLATATHRLEARLPRPLPVPFKALGVDIERNLSAPLVGIHAESTRLGLPSPASAS